MRSPAQSLYRRLRTETVERVWQLAMPSRIPVDACTDQLSSANLTAYVLALDVELHVRCPNARLALKTARRHVADANSNSTLARTKLQRQRQESDHLLQANVNGKSAAKARARDTEVSNCSPRAHERTCSCTNSLRICMGTRSCCPCSFAVIFFGLCRCLSFMLLRSYDEIEVEIIGVRHSI
jgi:hypothetical protein